VKKLPFISNILSSFKIKRQKSCIFKNATHHRNTAQSNEFSSLEDLISLNNPVRFVDAFVDALSLVVLGFKIQTLKTEGRPSFDTKVFLKIYLYGYLNGLRRS
jgi:hypothetical protein